jgi:outer membrane protein
MEARDRTRFGLMGNLLRCGCALLVCVAGALHSAPASGESLTVTECVRAALARAPGARAAAFDVDAAAARVRAARAAYTPRLLATAEYGRAQGFDEVVTNGGSTAALLTVETTLLDGGLRNAQLAAARARLESANAIEQQRRADVALSVRAAYFAALAARAAVEIQSEHVQTLRAYVALLQRQASLGLVPPNDPLRAQIGAQTARTERRAAAAQLDAARRELEVLTGSAVAATALVEPTVSPFESVTDSMLDASPVMTDARAVAAAARREADAVRSEWRGHVTLTASGGAEGVQPGATFRDNGGGQFLLGVSVPLFDGGATTSRITAAAAAANAAAATLEQSRQAMSVALARADVEARRAQADLRTWRRVVPKAEMGFQLMRARYFGGGNVRLLEVLDALSQYVDARLNIPRAVLAYRLAVATQAQILGEVDR